MQPQNIAMKILDLFSGIGGFAIAADWAGFNTTQFVEIDPNAQKILRHHYPDIPIHDDVQTFKGDRHKFDIVAAGFPCTGTSFAGLQTGLAHPESSLFYEILRIAKNVEPKFIIIENPIGLIHNGLREVLALLRMGGYSSEIISVTAAQLGAGHKRERLFIVSYPHVGSESPRIEVCGASEVRALVQKARRYSNWLQVKSGGDGDDNGLSCNMAFGDRNVGFSKEKILVEAGLKGRLTVRILAGRSVTPQQALIPFLWIKDFIERQESE
ncbi:MAG: DNA methylase [Caudoviricetes sp.]|nr:MAG: DNA methylase [Caudoviricetes sp.]